MSEIHEDKSERILSLYSRLKQGKVIYKDEESQRYEVAKRTVQRDLADIQCFLQNQGNQTGEIEEIVYDKNVKGYRLETKKKIHWMPGIFWLSVKLCLKAEAWSKANCSQYWTL